MLCSIAGRDRKLNRASTILPIRQQLQPLLYMKRMLLQLSVRTPPGLLPRSNAQTPFVLISETELLMPPSQLTNSPIQNSPNLLQKGLKAHVFRSERADLRHRLACFAQHLPCFLPVFLGSSPLTQGLRQSKHPSSKERIKMLPRGEYSGYAAFTAIAKPSSQQLL